jgi:membrane associated rhomboid family serine protease
MNQCTLSELCGFGDRHSRTEHPTQWFRFIIPIFLHAGFVHIGFNMLLQIFLGRAMEKDIGSLRFALVYLSSGIFGFVLGGNFAPEGIASTGASGSLFGVIALMVLDLFYRWGKRDSPWVDLAWIIVGIAVSFVLGLLPGLDNFSHIGGFLMGLVLGVCLLHSPDVLRKRVGSDQPPYHPVPGARRQGDGTALKGFVHQPVQFFKGRKPLWWAWWLVRAAALIGVTVCFSLLLKNFYREKPQKCSWCKYLSCLVRLLPLQ